MPSHPYPRHWVKLDAGRLLRLHGLKEPRMRRERMCTEMGLHRPLPFPSGCPVGWRAEGHFQWPSRADKIDIRGHGKGLARQIRTWSVSDVPGNPKNVQRKHLKGSGGELSTPMRSRRPSSAQREEATSGHTDCGQSGKEEISRTARGRWACYI